ncbi:hypothetical protein V2J09_012292 [Rumex salicifolius]
MKTSTLYFLGFLSICIIGGSDGQSVESQGCTAYTFSGGKAFKACIDLPVLSSYLHWTYNPAAATVDLAYRRAGVAVPGRWVSWAINPSSGGGMVGSQCLVATVGPDGKVMAYTSPVMSYSTGLREGQLSFNVSGLKAAYAADLDVILFATLEVPMNETKVNHVWQDGPLSAGGLPLTHLTDGPNMRSVGTLDFLAGADHEAAAVQGNANGDNKRPNTSDVNSGIKVLPMENWILLSIPMYLVYVLPYSAQVWLGKSTTLEPCKAGL